MRCDSCGGDRGQTVARRQTRRVERFVRVGPGLLWTDASNVCVFVEDTSQAAVHAIPLAMAALHEHYLHPLRDRRATALVAARSGLCPVAAGYRWGLAIRAGSLV